MSDPIVRPKQTGEFPVLTDGIHTVALGNGSQLRIALMRIKHAGSILVGVVGDGCYEFTHAHHHGYIGEKLKLMEGDAQNMSDLIACQFGEFDAAIGGPARGHYYNPRLCTQ